MKDWQFYPLIMAFVGAMIFYALSLADYQDVDRAGDVGLEHGEQQFGVAGSLDEAGQVDDVGGASGADGGDRGLGVGQVGPVPHDGGVERGRRVGTTMDGVDLGPEPVEQGHHVATDEACCAGDQHRGAVESGGTYVSG